MIGTFELIVAGLVALILFGPDRLPELAKQAGSAIRTIRDELERADLSG